MQHRKQNMMVVMLIAITVTLSISTHTAQAHCDRVNGPVAKDANEALTTEEFQHAAIWVGEEQTKELRNAYEQSLEVYQQGGAGKDLAKRYFMETTVRLHRQAEGFPYTGLKETQPVAKDIAMAEKALETGELQPVLQLLTQQMEKKVKHLFTNTRAAADHRKESIEAGRKWADAYVRYVIFVHGLYRNIEQGPAHGVGE